MFYKINNSFNIDVVLVEEEIFSQNMYGLNIRENIKCNNNVKFIKTK